MQTATSPYGAELKLGEEIVGLLDAARRQATCRVGAESAAGV